MTTSKDDLPFSKRYGYEPINVPFQVDHINDILRIDLWNAFYLFIHSHLANSEYSGNEYRKIYKLFWIHFFRKAFDDFPNHDYALKEFIREHIEKGIWYKVYEFFEFVFRNSKHSNLYSFNEFIDYVDDILIANNSGYRIINNKFIPITNKTEIKEIKLVSESSKKFGLTGIQEHLSTSIDLISKKPVPDYRNSIKESISMVEVISRIIEPNENTLGKALNRLGKNQKINTALKTGFEKLYTYTNDKNGIRHALMDEQIINPEDAKFFLVSCSAFTNYLIEKAKKENLLNDRDGKT
jgi:hypothetical protein